MIPAILPSYLRPIWRNNPPDVWFVGRTCDIARWVKTTSWPADPAPAAQSVIARWPLTLRGAFRFPAAAMGASCREAFHQLQRASRVPSWPLFSKPAAGARVRLGQNNRCE